MSTRARAAGCPPNPKCVPVFYGVIRAIRIGVIRTGAGRRWAWGVSEHKCAMFWHEIKLQIGCTRPEFGNVCVCVPYCQIRPKFTALGKLTRALLFCFCLKQVGTFSIVSNYGHGGAGMSLAWGCAGEVLELVQGAVMEATADKERGAWRGAEPVARL